jgi:hypothetical protein
VRLHDGGSVVGFGPLEVQDDGFGRALGRAVNADMPITHYSEGDSLSSGCHAQRTILLEDVLSIQIRMA